MTLFPGSKNRIFLGALRCHGASAGIRALKKHKLYAIEDLEPGGDASDAGEDEARQWSIGVSQCVASDCDKMKGGVTAVTHCEAEREMRFDPRRFVGIFQPKWISQVKHFSVP